MLLATLLCYVGFTGLCMSMPRHYADLVGGTLSAARGKGLKVMGWGALALSLWLALQAQSVGFALVHWFAALMGSAVLLVFVMSYRPGLALSLAGIGVALSPIVAFIQLLA
jgi:hypothetical protein